MKMMLSPEDYAFSGIKYSMNVHSQNGEDGILFELFKRLKISEGWACEFGAWDGKKYSNTFNLVQNMNWKCVMIESDDKKYLDLCETADEYPNIYTIKETIHYLADKGEKLDKVLSKTKIPKQFDLLSIDIDSCDYHVWKSLKEYDPKVVIIEYSGIDDYIIQREGAIHKKDIDGSTSFHPMRELGGEKGYELLVDTGNLIFMKKDLLKDLNA